MERVDGLGYHTAQNRPREIVVPQWMIMDLIEMYHMAISDARRSGRVEEANDLGEDLSRIMLHAEATGVIELHRDEEVE